MVAEYVAKITGDTSGLEKAIKSANGSMKKLEDNEVLVKLDYDGNVKGFNTEFEKILKSCPDITIQFQYNANQKLLNKELTKLKNLEDLKFDIDTDNADKRIASMISSLETAVKSDASEDIIGAKIKGIYKYANTIGDLGGKISKDLTGSIYDALSGTKFEKIFDDIVENTDTSKLKLFNFRQSIDKEISDTKVRVKDFEEYLSHLESKGASKSGLTSELEDIREEIKILRSDLADMKEELGSVSGESFNKLSLDIKGVIEQINRLTEKMSFMSSGKKMSVGDVIERWRNKGLDNVERYTPYNKDSGEASTSELYGEYNNISGKLVRSAIENANFIVSGFMHSHPERLAAFSDNDLELFFELFKNGVTEQVVTSFEQAISLDLNNVNMDKSDDILNEVIEKFDAVDQALFTKLSQYKDKIKEFYLIDSAKQEGYKDPVTDSIISEFKSRYNDFIDGLGDSFGLNEYVSAMTSELVSITKANDSFKKLDKKGQGIVTGQIKTYIESMGFSAKESLGEILADEFQQGYQNVLVDVFSDPKYLKDGIKSAIKVETLTDYASRMLKPIGEESGKAIVDGFREGIDAHSNSKEAECAVDDFANGVVDEFENRTSDMVNAAKKAGDAISEAFDESINKDKLENGDEISLTGYHGSRKKWTGESFDFEKTKASQLGSAMYFVDSPEKLQGFLSRPGSGDIKETELNLKKCFILTEDYISSISDINKILGTTFDESSEAKDVLTAIRNHNKSSKENSDNFRKSMLDMGYQGMYVGDYLANKKVKDELAVYDESLIQDLTSIPKAEFQSIIDGATEASTAIINYSNAVKEASDRSINIDKTIKDFYDKYGTPSQAMDRGYNTDEVLEMLGGKFAEINPNAENYSELRLNGEFFKELIKGADLAEDELEIIKAALVEIDAYAEGGKFRHLVGSDIAANKIVRDKLELIQQIIDGEHEITELERSNARDILKYSNQNNLLSDTTTTLSAIDEITQAEDKMGNEAQESTDQAKQGLAEMREEAETLLTIYRGVDQAATQFTTINDRPGTFFSFDKNLAKQYAGFSGELLEATADFKDALYIDGKGSDWYNFEYLGNGADEASQKIIALSQKIRNIQEELSSNHWKELGDIGISHSDFTRTNSSTGEVFSVDTPYYMYKEDEYDFIIPLIEKENALESIHNEEVKQLVIELYEAEKAYKRISDAQDNMYGRHSTDEFAELGKKNGYNSIIFENIKDSFDKRSSVSDVGVILDNAIIKQDQFTNSINETTEALKNQASNETPVSSDTDVVDNINEQIDATKKLEEENENLRQNLRAQADEIEHLNEEASRLQDELNSEQSWSESVYGDLSEERALTQELKVQNEELEKRNQELEKSQQTTTPSTNIDEIKKETEANLELVDAMDKVDKEKVDGSTNQVTRESAKLTSEEAKAMADLFDKAMKAAEAKEKFTSANKEVLSSIIESLKGLNSEGDGFANLNKIISNLTNNKNDRITDMIANLELLRDALSKPVDDNAFINAIRDLAQQGDSLKDLASVLKASKAQIETAKKTNDDNSADKSREESIKKYIDLVNRRNKLEAEKISKGKNNINTARDDEISKIKEEISSLEKLNFTEEENAIITKNVAASSIALQDAINKANTKNEDTVTAYKNEIISISSSLDILEKKRGYISQFQNDIDNLKTTISTMMENSEGLDVISEKELQQLAEAKKLLRDLLQQATLAENRSANEKTIQKNLGRINDVLSKNTKSSFKQTDVYKDYKRLQDIFKNFDTSRPQSELNELTTELLKVDARFKELDETVKGGGFLSNFSHRLSDMNAKFFAQYFSFQDIIRYGRAAFETIQDLDYQLVDLRKTANMSSSEMEGFYLSSNDVAKQLGITTSEVIQQASAWSRLNNIGLLYGNI